MPKQYVMLGGRTMLEHSIDALSADARVREIVVVVAAEDQNWQRLSVRAGVRFIAVGGATRAESVRNGLRVMATNAEDWILVHDAARPCLSHSELSGLIDALMNDEVGGLLAIPLADTLKRAQGDRVTTTVGRENLWRAMTPQMFRQQILLRALERVDLASVTDESAAVERIGLKPRLVAGLGSNIKVTVADDWPLATAILTAQGRIK